MVKGENTGSFLHFHHCFQKSFRVIKSLAVGLYQREVQITVPKGDFDFGHVTSWLKDNCEK